MTTSRLLVWVLVVVFAAGTGIGCKGGGKADLDAVKAELAESLAVVTQSHDALRQGRAELPPLRTELKQLEAVPEGRRSPEQAARLEELAADVAAREATLASGYDGLQEQLAQLLFKGLNEAPGEPETLEGLRIYAEEAMVNAEEAVTKAGDYKKALDSLQPAQSYYEQINQPVYQPLLDKVADLEERRFITQERFDLVAKGMTEDQVRELVGPPYYRNVKEDPEKKVFSWLYPKREGGAAAFYFRLDTRKVYGVNFEAVKMRVAGEE